MYRPVALGDGSAGGRVPGGDLGGYRLRCPCLGDSVPKLEIEAQAVRTPQRHRPVRSGRAEGRRREIRPAVRREAGSLPPPEPQLGPDLRGGRSAGAPAPRPPALLRLDAGQRRALALRGPAGPWPFRSEGDYAVLPPVEGNAPEGR